MLVAHAAATWFMCGLIWTVQSLHYPLFDGVGAERFAEYEARHTSRISRLLAVPALVEVVTGAALVWYRPQGVDLSIVLIAGALLSAIWLLTAVVQVPLHARLAGGFDTIAHRTLVSTNRWRTALWSVRGLLVLWMVAG